MIQNFTDLDVWKMADGLFEMMVVDAGKFPKTIIGRILTDQVVRAIGSISANIAEGVGRGGSKEFIRFLIISRGSLTESQNWLIKIIKLGWISDDRFKLYMKKLSTLRMKINGFIGKLKTNS